MANVICPSCNAKIDAKSARCPYCDRPVPQAPSQGQVTMTAQFVGPGQQPAYQTNQRSFADYEPQPEPSRRFGKVFGFRSNKVWKKAIATIWYVGWLLMMLLSFAVQPTVEASSTDMMIFKASSALLFFGMAALPFLLSDFGPLKKIPLTGSDKPILKALGLVIVAVIWLVLFSCINGLHSEEYKAAVEAQAAQQRAEQEEQRAQEEAEKQRQAAEKEAEEKNRHEAEEAAQKQAQEERQKAEESSASSESESAGDGEWTDIKSEQSESAPAETSASTAESDFVRVLVSDWGFSDNEARQAYAILRDVGCGDIKMLDGRMTEGTSLDAMRGVVGSHQVNFTADNKQIFYVQITGWKEMDYGWYVNWRGKLKYGIVDKKLSFDLYDSDTVDGGYIAYYDAANDAVVPWDESL